MRAAATIAAALLLCGTAFAADARLDPTFARTGKVVVAATQAGDAAVLRLPANAPVRPPAATLARHPARTLHARRARVTFAFRSDTAGATFRCATDTSALRSCRSPAAYTVGRGTHTFRVRAVSGGLNGPAATFRFSVVAPR